MANCGKCRHHIVDNDFALKEYCEVYMTKIEGGLDYEWNCNKFEDIPNLKDIKNEV